VPTESLTKSQLAAVTEIRETQFGVDIKLADKMRALELLGKHLGMFDGKQADDGAEVQIIDDL
jgi:phage terminase small subunit